jgi:hypothetical protein
MPRETGDNTYTKIQIHVATEKATFIATTSASDRVFFNTVVDITATNTHNVAYDITVINIFRSIRSELNHV